MNTVLRKTLIVIAAVLVGGGVFYGGYVAADSLVSGYPVARLRYRLGLEDGTRFSPGMHRGQGGGMGPGMMGRNSPGGALPLTLAEAKTSAEAYLSAYGNSDLAVEEIMIFDNNAYVIIREASTGLGAFELLVDPVTKVAYPEPGPNMMWNLKYGAMGSRGMMGGGGMMGGSGSGSAAPGDSTPAMTISPEKAVVIAQAYLDAWLPGAIAADDPMQFYGYYTLDYEVDGVVAGMLSVHGYSGQVFLHTWHGTFVEEMEY